jgi:hypothetical protein
MKKVGNLLINYNILYHRNKKCVDVHLNAHHTMKIYKDGCRYLIHS